MAFPPVFRKPDHQGASVLATRAVVDGTVVGYDDHRHQRDAPLSPPATVPSAL